MKIGKKSISSTSYTSAAGAYGKTQRVSGAKPVQDSIEVSESGSMFQTALSVAANTPDIRAEAVEGVQRELADGSYHRDEAQVAEKVITDNLESATQAL